MPVDATTYDYEVPQPGTYYFRIEETKLAAPNSPWTTSLPVTTLGNANVSISHIQDAAELGPDNHPQDGYFEITRTGSTDAPLTLSVDLCGTATVGTQYTTDAGQSSPVQVTIPAGASAAMLTVAPLLDGMDDPATTGIIATIESQPGANITTGTATANITELPTLGDVTVTGSTGGSITVSDSTPVDMFVPQPAIGSAKITIGAASASLHILWSDAGDNNSSSGMRNNFGLSNPTVALAPANGNSTFTVTVGEDRNGNGVLDANEVQRTIPVHIVSARLTTLGFSANNSSAYHAVLNDQTDAPYGSSQSTFEPIAYTRSGTTYGDVFMKITATLNVTGISGGQCLIKATIDGTDTDPAAGTYDAGSSSVTGTVLSKVKLPSTIDYRKDEIINWFVSPDNGKTWIPAGASDNRMYIVNGTSLTKDETLDTVLLVGCANAVGLTPGVNNNVVSAIWSGSFATRKITEADGKTVMKYWGPLCVAQKTPGMATTEGLAKYGDGQCGAWAPFFVNVLGAQGISATVIGITPAPAQKDYPKQFADGSSAIGFRANTKVAQGNDNAPVDFADHAVVELAGQHDVYDPSYGKYDSTEQLWIDNSVSDLNFDGVLVAHKRGAMDMKFAPSPTT